jgi:hypothetical protein
LACAALPIRLRGNLDFRLAKDLEGGVPEIDGAEVIVVAVGKRRIGRKQCKSFCFFMARPRMGTALNWKAEWPATDPPPTDDKVSGIAMVAQFDQIAGHFIEEWVTGT